MTGVVVLGTGRAGLAVAAACAASERFELVGMHTTSGARAGVAVADLVPAAAPGVRVSADLDALLADPRVGAVVHAAAQPLAGAVEVLGRCAAAGKAVVTLTGLVHPVVELGEEGARDLDAAAARGGGWIVGAGLNPGFALDLLPIVLAGLVVRPDRLVATRVTDMRHWGDAALRDQGGVGAAGTPCDQGRLGAAGDAEPAQELALLPSATVVGEALGDPAQLRESVEVLRTEVPRSDGRRSVAAGDVVGFRRFVTGRAGATDLELAWAGIFCVDPTLDGLAPGIEVQLGDGELYCDMRGDALADPYPATAARALASIAPLQSLPPGLHRPDRLPLTAP